MKKIEIPDEIYEKIEKKLEEYGFKQLMNTLYLY